MNPRNMFLTLGISNYLVAKRLSASGIPNNRANESWLVYFATPCKNIQLSYLGKLESEVKAFSFILDGISIRDIETVNAIVRHPEIRIIHSSGLYIHKGILRCEMAFVNSSNSVLNILDFDVLHQKNQIRYNVHEVPICESF
jgi:hypothetical protein